MRRLVAIILATLALVAGTTTVAHAYGRPVVEPGMVDVTSTSSGWSQIRVTRSADGEVRTVVFAPRGRWELSAHGPVAVVPELDGTFTVRFPCPVSEAGGVTLGSAPHVARTPAGVVTTMGDPRWSVEFTSPFGQHKLVPTGPAAPCVARVLPVAA